MSARLGRNPFEKKITVEAPAPSIAAAFAASPEAIDDSIASLPCESKSSILTKVFVDLPADAFILALKARVIARALMK